MENQIGENIKLNVVFLDCTQNYPLQFSAGNTKIEMMGRGILENGGVVSVHNGIVGRLGTKNIIENQNRLGIHYIIFPFRIHQLISWIFNLLIFWKSLNALKRKGFKNILVVTDCDFHLFLIYVLFGRLQGYKISAIFHEWSLAIRPIHFLRRPSIWLYCMTFGWFVDSIMPISHFLQDKASKYKRKTMLLPILAEFDQSQNFRNYTETKNKSYFLYCAFVEYSRIVKMVLDSYVEFRKIGGKEKLIMVLTGSEDKILEIKESIMDFNMDNFIEVKTKLPYNDLVNLYSSALGLLIPLNPDSLQDKARFSQKIAEYLSSYRPIITSNVGEIQYYFTNGKNAVITESYSVSHYANAMLRLSNDINLSNRIGTEGYELGKQKFNYKSYGLFITKHFEEL